MPSAALLSICGLQPAACCTCGPQPQCPGHPQLPASVPSVCSSQPQPQVPAALVLSPRRSPPSVSASAPSTRSIRPMRCTWARHPVLSPRRLRFPCHRAPVAHRLPHTTPPCTCGFLRSCVRYKLVPRSPSPPRPDVYGLPHAMAPYPRLSRRAPRLARYLFGATLSSSQAHRNAKATRTRAPPA